MGAAKQRLCAPDDVTEEGDEGAGSASRDRAATVAILHYSTAGRATGVYKRISRISPTAGRYAARSGPVLA